MRQSNANLGRSAPGTIWSQIEISVGIISACLPVYRPLFRRRRDPPHAGELRYEAKVTSKPSINPMSDHVGDSSEWSSVEAARLGRQGIEDG